MLARWQASPFFRMLQTGESMLRRRVMAQSEHEFPILRDYRAEGMTDYVAIINRFAPENIIGEMDCIYSSWLTGARTGSRMLILRRSPAWCRRLRWHSRRPRSRA